MKVWSIPAGQAAICIYSFQLKVYRDDCLQFSSKETYIFRCVSNEVHVFRTSDLLVNSTTLTTATKVLQKGVSQFSLGSEIADSSLPNVTHICICAFTPEISGKPAMCATFKLSFKREGN